MSTVTDPFNGHLADPRAETWALLALRQKRADAGRIFLKCLGQHARSQRKDIEKISKQHVPAEDIDLTVIAARRDGLYDQLPEALFHESGAAKARKQNEAEDRHAQAARTFFMPFEQDPFRLRVAMLDEELASALGERSGQRDDAIARLWDLPEDLDARTRGAILHILPWLNRAVGDLEMTASCITLVVGHPVVVAFSHGAQPERGTAFSAALGQSEIGTCVAGASLDDGWPVIEVTVSDVPLAILGDPTSRRSLRRILEVLSVYLLPVHLDVRYTFVVRQEDEGAVIGDPARPGILALNLRL